MDTKGKPRWRVKKPWGRVDVVPEGVYYAVPKKERVTRGSSLWLCVMMDAYRGRDLGGYQLVFEGQINADRTVLLCPERVNWHGFTVDEF